MVKERRRKLKLRMLSHHESPSHRSWLSLILLWIRQTIFDFDATVHNVGQGFVTVYPGDWILIYSCMMHSLTLWSDKIPISLTYRLLWAVSTPSYKYGNPRARVDSRHLDSGGTNRLAFAKPRKFSEGKEPRAGNINSGRKFAEDLIEWELNCMLSQNIILPSLTMLLRQ